MLLFHPEVVLLFDNNCSWVAKYTNVVFTHNGRDQRLYKDKKVCRSVD